jgi:hypothetical protein
VLEAAVYPALMRSLAAVPSVPFASAEGEAVCFQHPGNRAALPCDACGRFLCTLCDLEIGSRHLCPECVARESRAGGGAALINERILWDRVALSVALLPMLIFYFTVFTAPIAIFIALRHWKTPGSLVAHGRWRFVVAILVATLQIAGWASVVWLATSGSL